MQTNNLLPPKPGSKWGRPLVPLAIQAFIYVLPVQPLAFSWPTLALCRSSTRADSKFPRDTASSKGVRPRGSSISISCCKRIRELMIWIRNIFQVKQAWCLTSTASSINFQCWDSILRMALSKYLLLKNVIQPALVLRYCSSLSLRPSRIRYNSYS